MLERFAAQVLNRYIGQYIENFNPDKLSIGVVQGAVELEDLHLRKDALKEFDLPGIEVKWGSIGKISLRIPSYRSYSEPWIIDINKLYLIVTPTKHDNSTFDDETDKQRKEESKNKQLFALEEKWNATQGSSKSMYAIWHSYSSSIITNIVENLQVHLHDLHIRYEDDLTLPQTFSCGVHVNVLSTQTTNENWEAKPSHLPDDEKKWKRMLLQDMSFYWDTQSTILGGLDHQDVMYAMENAFTKPSDGQQSDTTNGHNFIVRPVSGEVRLTRNCSPFPIRIKNKPRLSLNVGLPTIPLCLNKTQFQQISVLLNEVTRWGTRDRHKSGRPLESIKQNPKLWWRWAIDVQLTRIRLERYRQTSEFLCQRVRLVVQYVKAYKNYVHQKYVLKSQASDFFFEVKLLEADLTFAELRILREIVYSKLDDENELKRKAEKVTKSKLRKSMKGNNARKKNNPGTAWRWAGWLGKWGNSESQSSNQTEIEDKQSSNENSVSKELESFGREISDLLPQDDSSTLHESVFKDLDEEEILEMFGEDLAEQGTTDTFLRRDSLLLRLNFSLESGSFTLLSDDSSEGGIVSLEFNRVKVASEWRPRYDTHEIQMKLGGIILKDLDSKNKYFSHLVRPLPIKKHKPNSPIVNIPGSSNRNFTDVINNLFQYGKSSDTGLNEDTEEPPVFSLAYEKLPDNDGTMFSNVLQIVTAPLSLTFLPGLLDRLNSFFKSYNHRSDNLQAVDSELLTSVARKKYEAWKVQAQAEVKNTVRRLMEGKQTAKVNKDRWAVSLDIFAPELTIPQDWSSPNTAVAVVNLGHMTFENHSQGVLNKLKRSVVSIQEHSEEEEEDYNSDDDFMTPPGTPGPSSEESKPPPTIATTSGNNEEKSSLTSSHSSSSQEEQYDHQQLSKRMLREKMYDRYHLHFADLQVLIAPDHSVSEGLKSGDKEKYHLVKQFSVDLTVERRVVSTVDPEFPSLVINGNLPDLTLRISHNKIETVLKCLNQFSRPKASDTKPSPQSKLSVKNLLSPNTESTNYNIERAQSKQLACDFSVNQISVVLEYDDMGTIMSVFEISGIQSSFVQRRFDSTTSLSIYNLLLIDVMQQLGQDYELLLASHRSVFMDVGSGHMLDSGTTSPDPNKLLQKGSPCLARSSSDIAAATSKNNLSVPQTSSVLRTVADNLSHVSTATKRYFFPEEESGVGSEERVQRAEDERLICLEVRSLRKGSPDLVSDEDDANGEKSSESPRNVISGHFNVLDVVFNAQSWITILNFLHKLKPASSARSESEEDRRKSLRKTPENDGEPPESEGKPPGNNPPETHLEIDFKKLNVLLLRHVRRDNEAIVGRKVATVTMLGARVTTDFHPLEKSSAPEVKVLGSVASLMMKNLTAEAENPTGVSKGLEILNVGSTPGGDGAIFPTRKSDDSQTKAFSFLFQRSSSNNDDAKSEPLVRDVERSVILTSHSDPVVMPIHSDSVIMTSHSDRDVQDMVFDMENVDKQPEKCAPPGEMRLEVGMASACYIHSPRLIAEVLALTDEVGDFTRVQMTTATRQAYKDMARSILDKVSNSMVMLGKSTLNETVEEGDFETTMKASNPTNSTPFYFQLEMETPIVAIPKFPGSFELLVANLGQINVKNHPDESVGGPFDKLSIDIININLRSHRQKQVELAAKQADSEDLLSSGPSITDLKQKSLHFMKKPSARSSENEIADIEILHNTTLHLSIDKVDFIPSQIKELDGRKCCDKSSKFNNSSCCEEFNSCLGAINDKRMCITIHASSSITVTLSKHAYEQVLKTLDNLAYGGDIDLIQEEEEEEVLGGSGSFLQSEVKLRPAHSVSAPVLSDAGSPQIKKKSKDRLLSISTVSSHHSTPRSNREFGIFEAPGLTNIPANPPPPKKLQLPPQLRKYTPISADFHVQCLIFQLSEDLSEGEQGIVKVTLEDFSGAYEKENRFGASFDLSLGSIDIEDLLQAENSPHRHIVVSSFPDQSKPTKKKTDYLSTSCPAFPTTHHTGVNMSTSMPSYTEVGTGLNGGQRLTNNGGMFRPYANVPYTTGTQQSTPRLNQSATSPNSSQEEQSSPTPPKEQQERTLVHIKVFLVDGKSQAYKNVYDRVNRRIAIDFNSLDCKINLQTWVVLLDFFGIGTSPKKTFQLDRETEETFSWDQRLDIRSFYENQPQEHINSEIDFKVRCFNITCNKLEYELLKANVAGLQSHVTLRDGTLQIAGQLGNVSVSDLSPNGSLYRERFIFTGDKALDFDIKKYDEYDHLLQRDFDISIRLRMSSIRYVHTNRFQNETVAFFQHFQQLQEVLGRMRAASVGQSVRASSCRQARVLLDVETDAPIILIPECSHAERLIVANLGHIRVKNSFKRDGDKGTLSHGTKRIVEPEPSPRRSAELKSLYVSQELIDITPQLESRCILDVIQVTLDDMDLFTATYSSNDALKQSDQGLTNLVFPSYSVTCNAKPLLREKAVLQLQMERNLEKEITHEGVPDTALSATLSTVYCAIDHAQYWLVRGVLDHNTGEAIPDFPQPTASLQPSKLQTVLTGSVHTGLSVDFDLTNVSIELLERHETTDQAAKSLGRIDFVKSVLSYRAYSNNVKTTNLSCESFRAHNTRWSEESEYDHDTPPSVFTTVLGPLDKKKGESKGCDDGGSRDGDGKSKLQFEIFQRSGPGVMEMTALLNNMRVYVIVNWLLDINKYLIENPNQQRCDSLRAVTAQLMAKYGQQDSGNQRGLDKSGQLEPEIRKNIFKMSFTDTEFVMVEDCTSHDTDGVILRSTALLHFAPDGAAVDGLSNLPLRCSLQSLEVFSCQLDKENETALSIIDPVTINLEVRPLKQKDLTQDQIDQDLSILDRNLLDVYMTELNMRVSYNDVMLFLSILKSLPSQVRGEKSLSTSSSASSITSLHGTSSTSRAVYHPPESAIERLVELGYSRSDVVHSLTVNGGNVSNSGSWLVANATLQPSVKERETQPSLKKAVPLNVAKVSLVADHARICLIDDCAEDCDVPLTEIAVHHLNVSQDLARHSISSVLELLHGQCGSASFKLTGDHYNRMRSLWEPFLEPWRCGLNWNHELGTGTSGTSNHTSGVGKWNLQLKAIDRFDISVTSTLIETVKMTAATWRHHYARVADPISVKQRKRQPFVPYILRNLTGCLLQFATQTSQADQFASGNMQAATSNPEQGKWTEVYPGDQETFHFATIHEKRRHDRTASLKLHQIRVQLGKWKALQPVTVSKVGVYFRHAYKQINTSSNIYESSCPVRVVFSVTLEGSAQKVVTVRSALAVRSRVKIPVQLRLECGEDMGSQTMPVLAPGETQYIPIEMTSCSIRVCPRCKITGPYHYSTSSIVWKDVPRHKNVDSKIIECVPSTNQLERPPFYFAVSIHRKPYPSLGEEQEDGSSEQLPGHTIIILPPLVISNLLPSDLQYYIRDTLVNGTLKPGVDATPHHVYVSPNDDLPPLTLGCLVDGFVSCKELVIPSVVQNSQMRMMLGDFDNRTLILNVRILWRLDCSVKVSIMAGYWIVNKTGLPIIVKQEGCHKLAAGQHRAHEQARSLQPLMFSYTDRNEPYLCTMRLGREVRMDDLFKERNAGGKAVFCENFSTDGGSCTRNLKVITTDNTPAREFYIGISVRRGWGRYLHTHIVTIAPRFLLINKTKSRKLSFAQRHAISYTSDAYGTNCHLTTMPGSSAVFHWPRVDLDTLLCVKLADETACQWSGGFFIDRTDAFHVQLRIATGSNTMSVGELHPLSPHCVFLSIEVTLVDATYCICVSDADPNTVPPPLRVDNMSSAPIIFKQVGVEDGYNTEVVAESRLAYACDEPCLPHYIQCSVRGGSSTARLDMSNIGTEKELFYENYIYITIGTPVLQKTVFGHSSHTAVVLVLDVQGDHRSNIITLQPLRSGKRSQLWRMTADGKIFHEGSSPPEKDVSTSDLHHRRGNARAAGLVLDISEMAFNMGSVEGIPLALRAGDERRRSTQTWSFGDGRLKCRHKNLCVQTNYLEVGGIVKLAAFDDNRVILPHESCSRHKLIPGSGMLSLKVVRDGPTRVLRIVDIRQKRAGIDTKHSDWTMVENKPERHFARDQSGPLSTNQSLRFSVTVTMERGLGVSLVSNAPEELVYLMMSGVHLEATASPGEETFLLRVQKIQIDNQLLDGYPQVMLSPIMSSRASKQSVDSISSSTDPLLSVHAVRQPTNSKMYQIYKSVVVDVGRLSLEIEERLLLKLLHFAGVGPGSSQGDSELLDKTKVELNRTVALTTKDFSSTRRYYFDTLKLATAPLRLTVITASRLVPELKAVKRALGILLIQFERAPINLQAYLKRHLFESFAFIIADFTKHIKDQLKSQAARILGSVDFLGNPIGLLSDVKAGVSGLARGNVHNMVKHITHGLSDSTAKVAGTLSDRLGAIAMDREHDEKRKAIQSHSRDAGSHVLAGLQGLMTGVIGGFTSVVTQTVKGVQDDGAKGFITGIGKGVVGTVTKPVSGILDLASQSASAVREISLSKDRQHGRVRAIRCCHSFQGCLQCYSSTQAEGQQFLYTFNRNDYSEHFYALHKLSYYQQDNMMVLITNKKVYFVKESAPDIDHVQLSADYANLSTVTVVLHSDVTDGGVTSHAANEKPQLELVIKRPLLHGQYHYQGEAPAASSLRYKFNKPRVTCHSRDLAEKVCQQINYAMSLASEQTETLDCDPDDEEAEDKAFEFDV